MMAMPRKPIDVVGTATVGRSHCRTKTHNTQTRQGQGDRSIDQARAVRKVINCKYLPSVNSLFSFLFFSFLRTSFSRRDQWGKPRLGIPQKRRQVNIYNISTVAAQVRRCTRTYRVRSAGGKGAWSPPSSKLFDRKGSATPSNAV